jgi:hypothetical protein
VKVLFAGKIMTQLTGFLTSQAITFLIIITHAYEVPFIGKKAPSFLSS